MTGENPISTLENAMTPLVEEIFQNGMEEGNRIWTDANNPLPQAMLILLRAHEEVRLNASPEWLKDTRVQRLGRHQL